MTRSELIQRLSERHPQLLHKDAEVSVTAILGALHDALVQGRRIEIRGFGSFSLTYRPPRKARNPRTGEPVAVSGYWTPHFKAGKELRTRVDYFSEPEPLRLAA